MKERHKQGAAFNAKETLRWLNIGIGQDFTTLKVAQVAALSKEATRVGFEPQPDAAARRAKHFFDQLQRHARLLS